MAEQKNVRQVLAEVQRELNVPKDQYNSFGKYKFRNLESINLALKPLCEKHKCGYYLTDDIVFIEGRFYLKATATFYAFGCDGEVSVTAWAREEDEKKGMDEAQITGLSSSYARKYAMCGLFAVDSGEEVDGMDNRAASTPKAPRGKAQPKSAVKKVQKQEAASVDDFLLRLTEFAEMKGKTVDEVIGVLNKTVSMQKLGVAEGTVSYTDEQTACAAGILASWIAKSKE